MINSPVHVGTTYGTRMTTASASRVCFPLERNKAVGINAAHHSEVNVTRRGLYFTPMSYGVLWLNNARRYFSSMFHLDEVSEVYPSVFIRRLHKIEKMISKGISRPPEVFKEISSVDGTLRPTEYSKEINLSGRGRRGSKSRS